MQKPVLSEEEITNAAFLAAQERWFTTSRNKSLRLEPTRRKLARRYTKANDPGTNPVGQPVFLP
jgi:hypothetical protein